MFATRILRQSKIYRPEIMDVYRDTIQTIPTVALTLLNKQTDLFNIITRTVPVKVDAIEVGSFASHKVLPIMADTKKLLNYSYDASPYKAYYILSPSCSQLMANLDETTYQKIAGLSFITSASEQFQLKNVRRTLDATHKDIIDSLVYLNELNKGNTRRNMAPLAHKLYVSCINECPVSGARVPHYAICAEVARYIPLVKEGLITNICLSDTCGTLTARDFKEIIELLHYLGLPYDNMGVHLHVSSCHTNRTEAIKLLWAAFDKHIGHFDVSTITTTNGGCSVTMDAAKCNPNLPAVLFRHAWDTR